MIEAVYGGKRLVLDDEHVYRLDGQVLPGNTGILKDVGVVDDRFYTEESRVRGTMVHAYTHHFDENDLYWPGVREDYKPFVDGWVAFRKESGFVPWKCEFPVYHSAGFATTLDRVGLLNGRPVILEIKTGSRPAWVGLQTAAQMLAVRERMKAGELELPAMPTARFSVTLASTGRYKLDPCPNASDEYEFLALLTALNIRRKYRK